MLLPVAIGKLIQRKELQGRRGKRQTEMTWLYMCTPLHTSGGWNVLRLAIWWSRLVVIFQHNHLRLYTPHTLLPTALGAWRQSVFLVVWNVLHTRNARQFFLQTWRCQIWWMCRMFDVSKPQLFIAVVVTTYLCTGWHLLRWFFFH